MSSFTDQTGNSIVISFPPRRIVSLVPSQTELLYDLDLNEAVVGITKFCVHPSLWFNTKKRIGGTKTVKLESVHALQPDLVIANKEENVRDQIEELQKHYPVWVSDVRTLEEALQMIRAIGDVTFTSVKANAIADQVESGFAALSHKLTGNISQQSITVDMIRCAYLIWKDPLMAAGGDTFIHAMLQACGIHNIYAHTQRYPVTSIEELREAGCQLLILSSEPFPFREKHKIELREKLPGTRIILADGEIFSWYGSRLLHAPAYFEQLIASIKLLMLK